MCFEHLRFQNSSLTWYTSYPNFTYCFKKTVLIWIPCLFLWLFAGVEIYFLKNSTRIKSPSSWKYLSKFLINCSLVVIVITDALITVNNFSNNIHDVDIYSPILQTSTFVSMNIIYIYPVDTYLVFI